MWTESLYRIVWSRPKSFLHHNFSCSRHVEFFAEKRNDLDEVDVFNWIIAFRFRSMRKLDYKLTTLFKLTKFWFIFLQNYFQIDEWIVVWIVNKHLTMTFWTANTHTFLYNICNTHMYSTVLWILKHIASSKKSMYVYIWEFLCEHIVWLVVQYYFLFISIYFTKISDRR